MKTQRKEQKTFRFPHGRQKEPVTDEVINKHLPFVRAVAGKIHRSLPPGIDLESLINSGVVGLLEALERYDPGRASNSMFTRGTVSTGKSWSVCARWTR